MDRQVLLVLFCELVGINKQSEFLFDVDEIVNFCSVLFDYLFVGYFEVFDIFVEDDDEGFDLKDKFYFKLIKIIDVVFVFNDMFV